MEGATAIVARAVGEEAARGLIPHLEAVELPDGAVLFEEGVPASQLLVVVDGTVEIRQQTGAASVDAPQPSVVAVRGPGAWLGEVAFIDSGPATATVVAKGPVGVLRIDHAALVALATSHPEVASPLLRHVSRQIGQRIADTSSGIIEKVGVGQYRVRKPEEVRGWVSQVLGWLVGGEEAR